MLRTYAQLHVLHLLAQPLKCFFCALLIALSLLGCASSGNQNDLSYKPPEETESRRRAKIRLELAVNYYQQKQSKTALDEIAQALQIDSEFSDAYVMRGLIMMDAGQNNSADESFKQALRLSPKDPDANNTYGWFLCQTGKQAQSFAYFNAAADTPFYATPAKALQNAGICAADLKDYAKAESYYQRAFKLDPAQPATLFNMSKLYLTTQDYERAAFYSGRLSAAVAPSAETVWLALRVAHFRRDVAAKTNLATALRRDFSGSKEWNAFQRNAFDD